MAEEDHHVAVAVVPKFDMPRHQSNLSSNDVKSLVKRYEIPLDLHLGVPSEWHTMDQLPEDAIGAAISAKEEITQHTTPPLPVHQSISNKTASQLEVEVEDPKVFTAKEKKKGTIQLKENLTLSP
ncbi:hypothetical protein Tco_1420130 [Tanacetum coccineum]